jgi:hypothetical protein
MEPEGTGNTVTIRVDTTPPGARVTANGSFIRNAPANLVEPVSEDGRLLWDVTISVSGGSGSVSGGGSGGNSARGEETLYIGSIPPARVTITNGIFRLSEDPARRNAPGVSANVRR